MKSKRKTRPSPFVLLAPACALLVVGLATAGQFNGGPGFIIQIDKRIQGPTNAGQFGRCATGDFDGDLRPDIAVERGNKLEFIGSPGVYGWWAYDYGQIGGVNDMTRIPPLAGDSTDGLVVVGGQGATKCNDFGNQHPFTKHSWPTTTTLGGAAWVGAVLVDARDVPGDPAPRIVGVMSDRRTLRQLRHDGTGYVFDEAITLSVPLPEDIVELELVDFSDDVAPEQPGTPEIVIATTSAVAVFDLDGSLVALHTYNATTSSMLSGSDGSGGLEWVAAVATVSNGAEYMRVYDAAGAKSPLQVPGAPGVAALSAIDWGYAHPVTGDPVTDSETDIVFSLSDTYEVWIAINQGGGTFDLAEGEATRHTMDVVVDPGYSGLENIAFFAAADLDGDGDDDLACPNQYDSAMDMSINDDIDQGLQQPWLSVGGPIGDPRVDRVNCTNPPHKTELSFDVALPDFGTHMRIRVWKHANPELSTDTNPRSIEEYFFDENDLVDGRVTFTMRQSNFASSALSVCGTPMEVELNNAYFWEQCMVTRQGNETVDVFPPLVFGLETHPDGDYDEQFDPGWILEGTDPIEPAFVLPDLSEETVGCIIQTPCLPDLPFNKPVN